MSGVGFLMIAVVIAVIGSVIVWLRHRQPNNPLASVGDFEREMQALGTKPPTVADGQLEARPRSPMNTVSVRPNSPVVDDDRPSSSVADDLAPDGDSPDEDASHEEHR